ncbi:hypothetical protein Pelo_16041 [Pelomyxa schiedti]|nr:hypothetical protein Pelo_16041 [Pelomyxa schiedti]
MNSEQKPTTIVNRVLLIGSNDDALRNNHRVSKLLSVDDSEFISVAHRGLTTMRISMPSYGPVGSGASSTTTCDAPTCCSSSSSGIPPPPPPISCNGGSTTSSGRSGATARCATGAFGSDRPHNLASTLRTCLDFINKKAAKSSAYPNANESVGGGPLSCSVWSRDSGTEDEKMRDSTLVHCATGNNQSVVVAIAYLISYCEMPLRDAASFVKRSRPSAAPAKEYLYQLMQYEAVTLKISTVNLEYLIATFHPSVPKSDMSLCLSNSVPAISTTRLGVSAELQIPSHCGMNRPQSSMSCSPPSHHKPLPPLEKLPTRGSSPMQRFQSPNNILSRRSSPSPPPPQSPPTTPPPLVPLGGKPSSPSLVTTASTSPCSLALPPLSPPQSPSPSIILGLPLAPTPTPSPLIPRSPLLSWGEDEADPSLPRASFPMPPPLKTPPHRGENRVSPPLLPSSPPLSTPTMPGTPPTPPSPRHLATPGNRRPPTPIHPLMHPVMIVKPAQAQVNPTRRLNSTGTAVPEGHLPPIYARLFQSY